MLTLAYGKELTVALCEHTDKDIKHELHTLNEPLPLIATGGVKVYLPVYVGMPQHVASLDDIVFDVVLVTGSHAWVEYIDLLLEGVGRGKNGAKYLLSHLDTLAAMAGEQKITRNHLMFSTQYGRIGLHAGGWMWMSVPEDGAYDQKLLDLSKELEVPRVHAGTSEYLIQYGKLLDGAARKNNCGLQEAIQIVDDAVGMNPLRRDYTVINVPYYGDIKPMPQEA